MKSPCGDLRRGRLFELSALDYDLYRPGYPNAIVAEVVSLAGLRSSSRLLEVGCGTGKATVKFAAHGYMVDCVDPGRRLVALAKRNCGTWPNVTFRVGTFEETVLEAGNYDLVFSAQAFHWVDPGVRLRKAAGLLRKGGSFALLYNYPGKEKRRLVECLAEAVQEESNGQMRPWDYLEDVVNWKREIDGCGRFRCVDIVRHQWTSRYSAESYAGLFRTYSDYLSLAARTRKRITRRILDIVENGGGYVTRSYDSVLIHAVAAS